LLNADVSASTFAVNTSHVKPSPDVTMFANALGHLTITSHLDPESWRMIAIGCTANIQKAVKADSKLWSTAYDAAA
jgi:hypothetical protein